MSAEKRAFPRFSFLQPVTYTQAELTPNGGVAGNISLGGIALKVQEFIPVGTLLELQIHLEQSPKIIWAKAQVVRIRELSSEDCYEIGLQFLQDKELIKTLKEHIQADKAL